MSVTARSNWARSGWRSAIALALLLGLLLPTWNASPVVAQETLPETASAAPDGAILFHAFDLDREGEQWQQTATLLERVGLPNALELWEASVLEEGARKGDFTEADLNALLGGELAFVATPLAVQRVVEHHERGHHESHTAATPMAAGGEAHGVTAILLPGDPDAAWDYVERQVTDLAARHDVPVAEVTHGSGELLWIELPDAHEQMVEHLEDADLEAALEDLMSEGGMHGRPGIAAGRAGDFIIAGPSQADVTEIIDVVDGTTDSLADSATAQRVAAELPAETLSFTYVDGAAVLDALGEEMVESLQAMSSPAEQAMWRAHSGLAISAVEPGFRIDTITVPAEGGSLGAAAIANDPAVSTAAERVPAGTFLYQAGVIPDDAFAGAAYMLAAAVNGEMAGEEWEGNGFDQLPSAEEIDEQIAAATATLGFDPRGELFDLLGGEFIAYSSFPTIAMDGFGLDAVAAVTTSEPDTLAETAQKIAASIERADVGADISTREEDGDTIYILGVPEMAGGPTLEFGVIGDQVVVGTGRGIAGLMTEPAASLAADPQYQSVMDLLPGEYHQVAYVDVGQAIDALTAIMGAMDGSQAPGAAVATPGAAGGSPANIRALAGVSYQREEAAGSSVILYIAESQS